MNQLTNTTTRGKAERLRLRQAAFTMKIEGQTSRKVSNLDYFDSALGQSLHSLIMTIKSTAPPAIPLFHSVDPRWDGNGWVFSFLPQLTAKANACVAGLLPYLRYLVGPELHATVEKLFTAEAVERSAKSFWDAEAGKVVSPTDALVDHTLDADPDYDFTALALLNPDGTTQAVVSAVPVRPGASGTPVRLPALGEDLVSTFGTQGNPAAANRDTASLSGASRATVLTNITTESQLSKLFSRMSTMETSIISFIESMKTNNSNTSSADGPATGRRRLIVSLQDVAAGGRPQLQHGLPLGPQNAPMPKASHDNASMTSSRPGANPGEIH